MALYLFLCLLSLFVHFVLIVPFINFLYKMRFQRAHQSTKDAFDVPTPIFDRFHAHKTGTPVGGGILIVLVTTILFLLTLLVLNLLDIRIISNYPEVVAEVKILLFTFISFSFLGIYDDLTKIFLWEKKLFFGMRMRTKLVFEIILALIISWWLFSDLKISIIHVPFFGVYNLSYVYVIFSTFVIVAFANAVNITDGLDGLATGVLMIALMCFWAIARSIIDVPSSVFIALWIGGLIAFLYFNIYPSRIFLGDAGALSFGSTFAVVGLILGKAFALPIIGGIFFLEILSSFLQLMAKKFFHKKLFSVSPIHLWFQLHGWEEPKIVMRFWIFAILFAIFGLMIAFMKSN